MLKAPRSTLCAPRELLAVAAITVVVFLLLCAQIGQVNAQNKRTCLTNLHDIGRAVGLYALDHGGNFPFGTYPGSRNWEVNPDLNPYNGGDCLDKLNRKVGFVPPLGGPPYTGCAYGSEFYRELMQVQLGPYLPDMKTWYCPQDRLRLPDRVSIVQGLQSYHWFPNWVYNTWCPGASAGYPGPFPCVHYAGGVQIDLNDSPPSLSSPYQSQRILLTDRGIFGWDGPDANPPNRNYNIPTGYNVVYFDGHTSLIAYGNKWRTLPATGWPPTDAP